MKIEDSSKQTKIKRAIDIIREDGLMSFFKHTQRKTEDAFYNIKGKINFKCNGVKAAFDSTYGSRWRKIKWRYESERDTLEDLLKELKPGDVYYDIGASLGLHTCFPAKKVPSGEVVAVEPYPPNLKQLHKNITLNGLNNTQVLEAAMSDSNGTINFNGESTSLSSEDHGLSVDTIIGDNLVTEGKLPQPNVIKIDVEGSEPLVIKGLEETLQERDCRLLYLEVHLSTPRRPSIEDFGMDLSKLRDKLEFYGFSLTTMKKRGAEVFVKGRK